MSIVNAKATTKEEYSGAVLVSFDAKWLDAIQRRDLRAVIRKRVPTSADMKWMYLYVNSPTSALAAKAHITKITSLSLQEAIHHAEEICLSEAHIERYMSGVDKIGTYFIDHIELAVAPIPVSALREKMVFFPPQSFIYVSLPAAELIDHIGGFGVRKSRGRP